MFTLPDTETDTDTNEKSPVKNCVEVFTLHQHNNAIEHCYNLSELGPLSVSVSGSMNAPLLGQVQTCSLAQIISKWTVGVTLRHS